MPRFDRILQVALLSIHCSVASTHADEVFASVSTFGELCSLAESRTSESAARRAELPAPLAELEYEHYRQIQFIPERATWWGELPFSFETFHRGFVQRDRVDVFVIEGRGKTKPAAFDKNNFSYGDVRSDSIPDDIGHAGIKINGFAGGPHAEELLTFLGASYFRARSGQTRYGTSARALAINVGMNQEEEFPFFRAFWLRRPREKDASLRVYGLLESDCLSGAYQFDFRPGDLESTLDVRAKLYFRNAPDKLALAPLTSMWIWGDGLEGPPKDARPAVHDADGLLVLAHKAAGEPAAAENRFADWHWRPFARQSYPSVSRLDFDRVEGFGLLQRNRSFYHYDDHNARYDLRPSVWVEPATPWKQGHLELMELPGAHEGVDNIGVYWVSDQNRDWTEPLDLAYRLRFFPGDHGEQNCVARATHLEVSRREGSADLSVRFSGPLVSQMSARSGVSVDCRAIGGRVSDVSAVRSDTGDWLAKFRLTFQGEQPAEVFLQLTDSNRKLTEAFNYLCPAETPEFVYPAVYTRKE